MYRHELRFVLRFGVRGEFTELVRSLHEHESARGWSPPRCRQPMSGRVNEVVIEHEWESAEAFRAERDAFHADPGAIGEILAAIADLSVPGTACESELSTLD